MPKRMFACICALSLSLSLSLSYSLSLSAEEQLSLFSPVSFGDNFSHEYPLGKMRELHQSLPPPASLLYYVQHISLSLLHEQDKHSVLCGLATMKVVHADYPALQHLIPLGQSIVCCVQARFACQINCSTWYRC